MRPDRKPLAACIFGLLLTACTSDFKGKTTSQDSHSDSPPADVPTGANPQSPVNPVQPEAPQPGPEEPAPGPGPAPATTPQQPDAGPADLVTITATNLDSGESVSLTDSRLSQSLTITADSGAQVSITSLKESAVTISNFPEGKNCELPSIPAGLTPDTSLVVTCAAIDTTGHLAIMRTWPAADSGSAGFMRVFVPEVTAGSTVHIYKDEECQTSIDSFTTTTETKTHHTVYIDAPGNYKLRARELKADTSWGPCSVFSARYLKEEISVTNDMNVFGYVTLQTTANQKLAMKSASGDPIQITSTLIEGEGFSFTGGSFPGSGGTCGNTITAECTVEITFQPAQFKNYMGSLKLTYQSAAGPKTRDIKLSGSAGRVLGQLDFSSDKEASDSVVDVRGLAITGTGQLLVADHYRHRVIGYAAWPTVNGQAPDIHFGQAGHARDSACDAYALYYNDPTQGEIGSRCFRYPAGVGASNSGKLIIADGYSGRALVWNQLPVKDAAPADMVFGKSDFKDTEWKNAPLDDKHLHIPGNADIYDDGSGNVHAFVNDGNRNRVLVWKNVSGTGGTTADIVLGQPDFTTSDANQGGAAAAATLKTPVGLCFNGTQLFIADKGNHRILVWNGLPASSGQAADFVIGQPDFTSASGNNGGRSASTLNAPADLDCSSTNLIVADTSNNRALIYPLPISGNQPAATRIIGQPDGSTATSYNGGVSAKSVSSPSAVAINSAGRIAVGMGGATYEGSHGRVLLFNSIPASDFADADVVIGQENFTSTVRYQTEQNRFSPYSACVYKNKLFVSDASRNRILVWSGASPENLANGTPPSFQIGQPDWTSSSANNGGRDAQSLSSPRGLACGSDHLAVADYSNHRVLIWNGDVTAARDADVVLGQPDTTSGTLNNGGISAATIRNPYSVTITGGKLYVADYNNHRVLVWNQIPSSTGAAANMVLGQPNFTSANRYDDADQTVSNKGIRHPTHVVVSASGKVAVAEYFRISIWNALPASPGTLADHVLGQSDFDSTSTGPYYGAASKIASAPLLGVSGDDLLASLYGRLSKFNLGDIANGMRATELPGDILGETETLHVEPMSGRTALEHTINTSGNYIFRLEENRLIIGPVY